MNPFLFWMLIYSFLQAGLGIWLSRKVRRSADFMVAGRRLAPGLIFTTLLAANIGAGTTVGAAALGYRLGWSAWWWVGSAAFGCFILANTVAPRIWILARSRTYHTLGDFLEDRYNRTVRGSITAIVTSGSLCLLAAQLMALSILFQVVIGVPKWVGATLGGTVMILYFTAGGLLSSAWVNLLQLAVLLAGFCLAIPFAVSSSGGWQAVVRSIHQQMGSTDAPAYLSPWGIGIGGILYYLALLVPSFIASPGLVQKVYAARSPSAARVGVNANALALLFFAALPPAFGILAAARFPDLPDAQMALFKVMTDLLPTWLGILGIAAIFSAEVSTCDAVLLMLTGSITFDLYRTFLNPGASDRVLMRVTRASSIGAGFLGVLVAIMAPSIISALTVFYGLVSVALLVPFVTGLYSNRPTPRAALAAIACSVPATLAIRWVTGDEPQGVLNPFMIGIVISFIVLWGVTLFSKPENRSRGNL